MSNKIAVILGTRPEIIKLSPVIRLLEERKADYFILHTGQHYSYSMDEQFFKDLGLPKPKWKLTRPTTLGPNKHDELVGWMKSEIKGILEKEKAATVLVQGDTDTVLAGAEAASHIRGTRIGHVEAGLRSYDSNMPEERNRIQADRLSHILFAPTEAARQNLLRERMGGKQIEVTGNTIVDAILQNLEIAKKRGAVAPKKGYALVTLHRPESVDNKERLVQIVLALEMLAEKRSLRIVFPLHPRTRQRLKEFNITLSQKNFEAVEPMGFFDFIRHEKEAELILTDSGGVQEEACILKVPCVTIRTTTERPETVEAGANIVAGYEPERIVESALMMLSKEKDWPNPFGDGHASEKILEALNNTPQNKRPRLSVIIPVYNEAQNLEKLVKKVLQVPIDKELIIVDDGSTDGTADILRTRVAGLAPNIRWNAHGMNQGKGAAIRSGLKMAQGEIFIIQDADLEYDPADFVLILKEFDDPAVHVVYGSRFENVNKYLFIWHWFCNRFLGAHYEIRYLHHFLGILILNFLSNILYNAGISDEATCYKAFRREVLDSFKLKCKGFEFCPEVTAKVRKAGYTITEVPITYHPRSKKEGKKLNWRHGFEAIFTLLKYRFVD